MVFNNDQNTEHTSKIIIHNRDLAASDSWCAEPTDCYKEKKGMLHHDLTTKLLLVETTHIDQTLHY